MDTNITNKDKKKLFQPCEKLSKFPGRKSGGYDKIPFLISTIYDMRIRTYPILIGNR